MAPTWSRRQALHGALLAGTSGLAGCVSGLGAPTFCHRGRTAHVADVSRPASSVWPMVQYDAANTGHNPDASGPGDDVRVAWRFSTCRWPEAGVVVGGERSYAGALVVDGRSGRHVRGEAADHTSTAAFVDGTHYLSRFNLEARDGATGEGRWLFTTDVDSGALPAPTVAGDTVYVPGSVGDNTLYAVRAGDGTERWRFPTGGNVHRTPAVVDGTVYVVDKTSTVYAIAATTGDVRWRTGFDVDLWRTSPAVVDDLVYLGSWDGSVLAVDTSDGTERWRTSVDVPDFRIGGPVAVADGRVFAAGREGLLIALDAGDGRERWRVRTGLYELGPPSVADGIVYVGATPSAGSGDVLAFDGRTGAERWTIETRERRTGEGNVRAGVLGSPAIADGVVYVASAPGDIYALTATDR